MLFASSLISNVCFHWKMRKISNTLRKGKEKGVWGIVSVPAETGKTGKENSRDYNNFDIIKNIFLSLQQYLDPGIIFCLKDGCSALAVICEQWSASFSISAVYSICVFYHFCVYPQKQQLFSGNSLVPVGTLLPWLTSVNMLCRNTNILVNL